MTLSLYSLLSRLTKKAPTSQVTMPKPRFRIVLEKTTGSFVADNLAIGKGKLIDFSGKPRFDSRLQSVQKLHPLEEGRTRLKTGIVKSLCFEECYTRPPIETRTPRLIAQCGFTLISACSAYNFDPCEVSILSVFEECHTQGPIEIRTHFLLHPIHINID